MSPAEDRLDDAVIRRLVDLLEPGARWPSGRLVTEHERPVIEWNLATARRDRAERRGAERARA